jgi:hypothetical protein
MQKSTLYITIVIIVGITILGVTGEYFVYTYYANIGQKQEAQTTTPVTPVVTESGSSENQIISFNFENPLAVGGIDQINHAVTLTVPPDTDVTKMAPTIQISDNATILPVSNTLEDFTDPVTYTVTAQNGATQSYTVTVNVVSINQTVGKSITSFRLTGFSPEITGGIVEDNHTITVVVPDGTDLTKLIPAIVVSSGATVLPKSGVVQDFTNPVTYTVTDIYGASQDYTVTVVTESNSG